MAVHGRSIGLATTFALTLVAPLVAAVAWLVVESAESPLQSSSIALPVFGSVTLSETYPSESVGVRLATAPEFSAVTYATGVLNNLWLSPGDSIVTGTSVGTVNDQEIVAYVSPSPLFRDITFDDVGDDVEVAQTVLSSLGYYEGPIDGDAGRATERAIRAFNAEHGWGDENSVLMLQSLIWAGPIGTTASSLDVSLGDTLGPGTAVFSTERTSRVVLVVEAGSLTAGNDASLIVNGVQVPYVVGTGAVSEPELVDTVVLAMGEKTEDVATVTLTTPVRVGVVPPSALIYDDSGSTCFFSSVAGPGTVVSTTGSSLGLVELDASWIGETVLVNPRDVRDDLSCG